MEEQGQRIFHQGSQKYEEYRRHNVNADTPKRYPKLIYGVESVDDVIHAVRAANAGGHSIGVRSGGHTYHCSPLLDDGILIDTQKLNRMIEYDIKTHEVSFGPSVQVQEISKAMIEHGRFFPHGHSPTVAAGGFLLAGGQGFFGRGWGATSQEWITKLEIVTAGGEVVVATRTKNTDLFWAARGSGTAFFGVVTKFWGRTTRSENIFTISYSFEMGDKYNELLEWAFMASEATPKQGTDINFITFWNTAFDATCTTDHITEDAKLIFGISMAMYTENIQQACTLAGAFETIPDSLLPLLIDRKPVQVETWDNIWAVQNAFFGPDGVRNFQINSFLNDPTVELPMLVKAIKPAICNLPTRLSTSAISITDVKPDESDAVFSLPQKYYISTFTQWLDSRLQPQVYEPMRAYYRECAQVACGMYVADYDPNCDDANHKVMTDTALIRFLEIRKKWDPKGLFPNYKAVVQTHDRIDRSKL